MKSAPKAMCAGVVKAFLHMNVSSGGKKRELEKKRLGLVAQNSTLDLPSLPS